MSATAGSVAFPPAAVPTAGNAVIGRLSAVAAGNVAAGKQSVTFVNVGTTDATVLTVALAPGESVTYGAYLDPVTGVHKRLPVIAYVASATAVLHISWLD